jgi:hypothetical protein
MVIIACGSNWVKRGVGSLIIPNLDSYDFNANTVLAHPTYGDDGIVLGKLNEYPIAKGSLDVVRARILTPSALEERIPVLNGPRLREIGASKWAQYELVPEYMPRTISIAADQIPDQELLDSLVGEQLVVKADTSQDSRHIKICSRIEVPNAVMGMRDSFVREEKESGRVRKNHKIDVQEYVKGLSWQELRGVDDANKEALISAETTELRIYCYVDKNRKIPLDMRYFATARALGPGYDNWISVDQDSVPFEAWEIVDEASDRLLDEADVPGGYFAVDLIKGKAARDAEERIYIREINTRDPMMVEAEDNLYDANMQRKMLANAMATMAKL